MKRRYLSVIIALQTIAALTGCGGGGGADEPAQHVDTPTTPPPPKDPRGFWQGTTTNGRVISGVVTAEGDYWFTYTLSANDQDIAGFYAGRSSVVTPPPNGTFTSANLREVNFDAGDALIGTISAPTSFTPQSTLTGTLVPVVLDVSSYDITGSFDVTAIVFNNPLVVPFSINNGTYDPNTGTGSWNVSGDVSEMGMGIITFDQAFTLDAVTGVGVLGAGSNCVGNGIACGGVGPEFNGPINAGGPIVGGLQSWVVTTPNFGSPTFAPKLTGPLLPVAADTLDLIYDATYEETPSLTALAGNYQGTAGVGTALSAANTATFVISSAGAISGAASIGPGDDCSYAGTAAVHSSGNVYDITLTVSDCTAAGTYAGVATYDDSDILARRVTVTALTTASERDKGLLFVGTKPAN